MGAEQRPLLPGTTFPLPGFARALSTKNGPRPQAIAHRGYKAVFAENSMASFVGAVSAGADALETDIQLTKDGVVVLSHDPTLKRCFGKPEKIIDCTWDSIRKMRTTREPAEPMPRLLDLLQYLAEPGLEDIWVLLDIKTGNDAEDVMRLIAETIDQVAPSAHRPWKDRLVLGIWATKYLALCDEHLPGFSVTNIGFSTSYARQFFAVPNISFNMLHAILVGPTGSSFIRDAKALNRPVFAWTVNDENKMRWCIREGLDGVFTDDPKKFLEVCEDWRRGDRRARFSVLDWLDILRIQIFAMIVGLLLRRRLGYGIDQRFVRRAAVEDS